LAEELGIHQMSILRFVPQGRGAENREALEITGKNLLELENILERIHVNSSIRIRFGAPFNCFNIDNQTKCTAGIDKAILRPDGFLFPCVSLKRVIPDSSETDIRKMNFGEIWNNSRIFNLIRSFHESVKKSNCRNCSCFPTCGGGCITQRMMDSDDISNSRDPYCQYSNQYKDLNSPNKKRSIKKIEVD
jgi:radical SAM protein with 4Fe4S-binding SPASM domain